MLELTQQKAKLSSYTPRAEIHGPERVPAATLKFEVHTASDVLAYFHPTLRALLYWKNAAEQSDLADAAHDAPNLRFPELGMPLAWGGEMVGASLILHNALGGASDIVLTSNVDDYKITTQEGGTVIVAFRCACHPDQDESGKLAMLVQTDVEISLAPPFNPQSEIAA